MPKSGKKSFNRTKNKKEDKIHDEQEAIIITDDEQQSNSPSPTAAKSKSRSFIQNTSSPSLTSALASSNESNENFEFTEKDKEFYLNQLTLPFHLVAEAYHVKRSPCQTASNAKTQCPTHPNCLQGLHKQKGIW